MTKYTPFWFLCKASRLTKSRKCYFIVEIKRTNNQNCLLHVFCNLTLSIQRSQFDIAVFIFVDASTQYYY